MKSLVSVIIPCYNAEPWVGEALQSCLDQTYEPVEIIVVDDGSTDRSARIVSDIAKKGLVPIRLIESAHHGAPAARNQGLAAAAGDYVQFLDADDLMSPRKIELQNVAARQNCEAVLCGPWALLKQSNGRWTTEQPRQFPNCAGDLIHQWLEGNFFVVHSFLWPRKTVLGVGGWDESLASCQDWDLYIRAVLKGVRFCFVPESMVYYRRGHSAVSISSRDTLDSLQSRIRVLDKIQTALANRGDLKEYRTLLAYSYYTIARGVALGQPIEAEKCFGRFLALSPDGRVPGSMANHFATRLLGVVRKERLARKLRALRRGSITA